jgi:arylsulfatase A-like enzyme
MAANGYQTSGIVSNPWLSPTHRLNQGFESYTMVAREDARLVTTEALSWLDRRSAEPFFLYVHFMDVHGPYNQIPSPYNEMFSPDTYPERKLTRAEQAGVPSYWKLSPLPDLRDYVIRYDREIRFVDAEIGRLLARLEALGVREDTLVVVTADHGLEFLEHGGWDMGYTLYDENLRVPLIMVLPAKLPRNRRIESQVRTVDIMPTILGILGIALQHEVQGQDLNPMIARSGELDLDALSEAVYRAGPGTPRYEFNLIKSLRTERFKIIDKGESAVCTWWRRPWWCLRRLREGASQAGLTTGAFIAATWSQPAAGSELYDLEADAGELNDLLEVPAEKPQHHAEEAAQLRQRLEANLTASQRYHSGGGKPLDAETLENLKSLGYID